MIDEAPASRYARICMAADQAAALIPSGAKVAMGLGIAQPPAILEALARRAGASQVSDISLYYMLATAIAGETVLRYELRDRIKPVSLFHGGVERALDAIAIRENAPLVEVIPVAFSQVPRMLTDHIGVDTLVTTVSPMDEDGNFSLGTNADYALAVSRTAGRVILEVNPHMPRIGGNCMIHVSQVTALVEHAAPLIALPRAEPNAVDRAIGAIIAGLVEDGDCLQMGIGALPDAVCSALHDHRHLGIHTELMTPGMAELMRQGVVDNSRKQLHPGHSIFTFAMGDKLLYDFIDGNPLLEAHPVDYVNDPAVIARNDRMVSVNATLQVDLDGACNSEFMNGRQFSAAGGQLDFVRGAYASRGGRSIIACHSTAARGTVSRIVPALTGPVTTPRNETQIVVTEYGWVDLKGKSVSERARALIGIAHPDFREALARP
ncbi:MAG: acetyl-CoA hydrolase/transferase C-terminal domain-containing protein [bacterium]|jgi:itaconate CoA-transferase|nr:acetyl-CoA hydrolase/transferase C-terminal domain-containing protein [bacterium]